LTWVKLLKEKSDQDLADEAARYARSDDNVSQREAAMRRSEIARRKAVAAATGPVFSMETNQTDVPDMVSAGPLGDGVNDMVLQIGSNGVKFAQRVSPNDVGVFSKPGGALSQAGGGTGSGGVSVNNFHLYGDGPSTLKMIERALAAGLLPA
jgi:hypothetical protein